MRDMSIFSRLPVVLETEEKDSFGPAGSLPSTRFQVFVTRSSGYSRWRGLRDGTKERPSCRKAFSVVTQRSKNVA